MLPLRHRFHLRSFPEFFAQAHRASNRWFMIYTLPHEKFEAAVVVPKKAGVTAVGRNRVKRQVYEFLQKNTTHLSGRLVVVVHVAALQASPIELERELSQLLVKNNVLV